MADASAGYIEQRPILRFLFGFISSLALLLPNSSLAATWDYGVILDLGVIYADNIFLEVDEQKQGDIVYTITPEFYLETDGERLDANLRYKPETYFYSDHSEANEVFHSVDATVNSTLIRDKFFIYLSAVNFQSIVTPDDVVPPTNLPITSNRVDARTLVVAPSWREQIFNADMNVELAYREVEFDDDTIQSNSEQTADFNLGNISRQSILAWGLEYEYRETDYENTNPWTFQRASMDLGIWASSSTRIFVVGGVETSFDNIDNGDMDSEFWEYGLQYKPSDRLNIELAIGDRSYGESFRANVTYRLRRGDLSFIYDEGSASRGGLIFDRRAIGNTDRLDNILDRPGRSDRFVTKRGEFHTTIRLSKSDLTLRIFSEERELRTSADGDSLDDESYSGAAIRWSWNIGAKTNFSVAADVAEREFSGRADDLGRALMGFAYTLSNRTRILLEASHATQKAKDTAATNFTENLAALYLRMEF